MAVLIKRYANRKLYNTETSRYITLKGIAKLLEEGQEVRVIDKQTGEDITQVALSQILVDNQRAKKDPSDTLLTQILSRGGDALYGAIKKSVDEASYGLGDFQDRFRHFVTQSDSAARGGKGFAWTPRADGEGRSPFSSDSSSSRNTASGGHETRQQAENDDSDSGSNSTGRGAWPRMGGLPDIREAIRHAVAKELDAHDLPRNRDIETLNQNLMRVAEAVERLESVLRERDPADD